MTESKPVWLVTGGARGLGNYFAAEIVKRGFRLVLCARDQAAAELTARGFAALPNAEILPIALDVTDNDGPAHVVAKTLEHFGRIDGLVNNAGYGLLGAIEEVSTTDVEAQFRTNVFGAHRMMQAVLPAMREARAGFIVNISSLGGFAASPGWGAYNASKFALEGLSEALALEVAPFGIRVMIVEPGSFRTGFLSDQSMRPAERSIAAYEETAGAMRERVATIDGKQAGDPTLAAQVTFDAILSEDPPLRLVLGGDAIARVEMKLQRVREDLAAWRHATTEMGFSGQLD